MDQRNTTAPLEPQDVMDFLAVFQRCWAGRQPETFKGEKFTKFAVRAHTRCRRCGRARGYLRKFQLCRICFRNLALEGALPGVTKSSW